MNEWMNEQMNEDVCDGLVNSEARGPGAVVKGACLESRRSRVRTPLWNSSFKETKCSFPALTKFQDCEELRDREVASSASDRYG